jgi:ligand-binding SRPBCC domain-containing protein
MWGARWDVSDTEAAMPFPCDAFVSDPALEAWRGVTVQAPADEVWPWVAQVRLAPYSFDWIDNGGRRSPRRLIGLPEPEIGDSFTACAGRPVGRIVAVEPGRSLTGAIGGCFLSYAVLPGSEGTSRLLLKLVMDTNRVVAAALTLGDLVMARRQLSNLKALAEKVPRTRREVRRTSVVGASRDQVWQVVTTAEGINDELWPVLRMTTPRGLGSLDLDSVEPGTRLGRSVLLLGGVLPVDYDDLGIAEIEPGHRFLERSTMLSMRSWRHERVLEDVDGGCRITDALTLEPRLALALGLAPDFAAGVVGLLFSHRHRRLTRRFGPAQTR